MFNLTIINTTFGTPSSLSDFSQYLAIVVSLDMIALAIIRKCSKTPCNHVLYGTLLGIAPGCKAAGLPGALAGALAGYFGAELYHFPGLFCQRIARVLIPPRYNN